MVPSSQRSLDETVQCVFISYSLGRDNKENLFEDMIRGDTYHKSDIAYSLNNGIIIYEHDPLYYHPVERNDSAKTETLLKYPDTLIVRGRIGASKLEIEDKRLEQLILPEKSTHYETLLEFIKAVQKHIPDIQFRLPDVRTQKQLKVFAQEMFKIIHPNYETKVLERQKFVNTHNLDMNPAHLVSIPVSTLEATIHILKVELGLSKSRIATCASLLGRDPDTLKKNANILQVELGLSKSKIATCASLLGNDPDTLKKNADILQVEFGLSKSKIAQCATLLTRDPDTLKKNANILKVELGLSKSKIATCASLLTCNPDTLKKNANILQVELGLSKSKIAQCASLLGGDPDTLKKKSNILKVELGLSKSKIATYATLLSRDPDTLKKNANILQVELGLSKSNIATCASLLTRDPDTLKKNANILQVELGLSKSKIAQCASLLGRDPDTLRQKASWFRQNNMDYISDPSILTNDLDRMKVNLDFFTRKCGIPFKSIGKRRITRFKVRQSHKSIVKNSSFMSSSPAEKIRILSMID